ncbi:MAG: hypothetical protein ACD_51C00076G0002 [uncultured bacterium]|nr:MAG: hypothetical protein ACD_51C00076G0002 [uncultured bacterium]OGJ47865.1 MAG: hypothetical protein A2244_05295 [Candidatus Peregrinibacteria bacterium RIFOXYA2_FULL_41_18]OGJ48912.1 MAG: hypothetical protein A2344_02755 [Candidatus Peregrinibacteria bacterium RIFOXYB12_FULL_41_12]OGJ51443.1 MAG: hypothetical protein A2336_03810 [Candidatus Peregrinibacteria bacterium RIFOXYB2_FULL_41_88]OGJ52874.1 MAG: hypothetical protein A2448_02025 [Candidatus Peregrinibacteria bacterium RIFOXYC2_FULL
MLVKKEILECVAYVLYKDSKDFLHYVGTAFFLGDFVEDIDKTYIYIITAKHVIAGIRGKDNDGNVYLRMNAKEGGIKLASISLDDWAFHDEDPFADAAVFFGAPDTSEVEYKCLKISEFCHEEILEKEGIGIGDEICLTGLFINHFGEHKNLPILRTGNIAMMPAEPVQALLGDKKVPMDAYLIECRSIGGLSGSPVFVHLGADRRRLKEPHPNRDIFYLLGLAQGHWDQSFYKEKDQVVDDINNTLEKEAVNKGIAIVTPIKKVIEIIEQDPTSTARKKKEENDRKELKKKKQETIITPANSV